MKKITIINLIISLFIISCSKNSDIIQNKIELTEISPMTGYVGDEITINFSNTNDIKIDSAKVLFNGIQSQIKDTLNNKLICVVPKNASTGKIEIKINNTQLESKENFVFNIPSFPKMYYYSGDWGNGLDLYRVDFNPDEAKFKSKKLFNTIFYLSKIEKVTFNKSNSRITGLADNNSYFGHDINTQGWFEGGCLSHSGCDIYLETMYISPEHKTSFLQKEFNSSINEYEYFIKEIGGNKNLISGTAKPFNNNDLFIPSLNQLVFFTHNSNPNELYFNSIDTKKYTSTYKKINTNITSNDFDKLFRHYTGYAYNSNKNSILLINYILDVYEYSLDSNTLKKIEIPELKTPFTNLKYLVFSEDKVFLYTYFLMFVLNLDDLSVQKFDLNFYWDDSVSPVTIEN